MNATCEHGTAANRCIECKSRQEIRHIKGDTTTERSLINHPTEEHNLFYTHTLKKQKEVDPIGDILSLFEKCQGLLVTKAHDYSVENDVHSNFKFSEFIAKAFPDKYKSYAVLIGTKIARISTLLQKGESKHENIEDSFIDLINYVALMYERYVVEQKHE